MNAMSSMPAGPTVATPAKVAVGQALETMLSTFDSNLGMSRRLKRPRALMYVTALFVALLLVWAAVSPVDRVVRTEGRVIPSGKAQLVQHLEGGIVSRVFVREGDAVERGANLVAVADLMANSTRSEKQARLTGLQAKIARLKAEAEGGARFAPPGGAKADSAEVRNEAEAFAARQARLQQSLRVLQEQAAQKRQEMAEQDARRRGLSSELEVARQQLALVNTMIARNAASQLELLEARGRVERLVTQVRESETALPRLSSAAQELQARIAEVSAQFRSDSRTALSDATVELRRLEEDVKTDEDRVRRTVITSPVAGTVNKVFANTVGGVVKPGETLLELTPADETIIIETRASPVERGNLVLGLDAAVRVAAFDYTVFGTLKARVAEISADSLVDERGERYFRVVLKVDADGLRAFGQKLGPGMNVSADVITGRRTILQYLLSPIRGLQSNAFRERK